MTAKKPTDDKKVKGLKGQTSVKEAVDDVKAPETDLTSFVLDCLNENTFLRKEGEQFVYDYDKPYGDSFDISTVAKAWMDNEDKPDEFLQTLYENLEEGDWSKYEIVNELTKGILDKHPELVDKEDEISDIIDEHLDITIPYNDYMEEKYEVEIGIDTGDSNTEFYDNPNDNYSDMETVDDIPDTASLVWLAQTQGYTKEDLFNAIVNEEYKNSKFLKSVREEVINNNYASMLVFLVEMSINSFARNDVFHIPADCVCGLMDEMNGAGGPLDIQLEKPVEVPRNICRLRFDETVGYTYTANDIYGGAPHTLIEDFVSKKIMLKEAYANAEPSFVYDKKVQMVSELREATKEWTVPGGELTIYGPGNKEYASEVLLKYYNDVSDEESSMAHNCWVVKFGNRKPDEEIEEMRRSEEIIRKSDDLPVGDNGEIPINTDLIEGETEVKESVKKVAKPINEEEVVEPETTPEETVDTTIEVPEKEEVPSVELSEDSKTQALQLIRGNIRNLYDSVELYENQCSLIDELPDKDNPALKKLFGKLKDMTSKAQQDIGFLTGLLGEVDPATGFGFEVGFDDVADTLSAQGDIETYVESVIARTGSFVIPANYDNMGTLLSESLKSKSYRFDKETIKEAVLSLMSKYKYTVMKGGNLKLESCTLDKKKLKKAQDENAEEEEVVDESVDRSVLTKSESFRYQLLDRLRSDCEYYINTDPQAKNLWAQNEVDHINTMYLLWDSFDVKPEWLSRKEIDDYAKEMGVTAADKLVGESFERSNVLEFPNGEYLYVAKRGNRLVAGGATNAGMFDDYSIEYDEDKSFDENLQDLYDKIIEARPELLDDMNESKEIDSLQLTESFDDNEHCYLDTEPTEDIDDWTEVDSKTVTDSDGFTTEYTWYTDGEKHIFMFGDRDIYLPNEDDADYVCESEEEARAWFDNYKGFDEVDESKESYKPTFTLDESVVSEATNKEASKEDAKELSLWADNSEVNTDSIAMRKNLAKRIANGTYDKEKAVKAFVHVIDSAVKSYRARYGNAEMKVSVATKELAAKMLLDMWEEEIENMARDMKEAKEKGKKVNESKKKSIKEAVESNVTDGEAEIPFQVNLDFSRLNDDQKHFVLSSFGAVPGKVNDKHFEGTTFYPYSDRYIPYLQDKLDLTIGKWGYGGWMYNDRNLVIVSFAEGDYYISVFDNEADYQNEKTETQKFYKEN